MFKFLRRLILVLFVLFAGYKIYQVHHDVKQVMKYQTLVREVLDEQDTAANEELVLAMIYTETRGKILMLCSPVKAQLVRPMPSRTTKKVFARASRPYLITWSLASKKKS